MSLIPIYTILILSLKKRYIYQYVCSSEESVIEHIYKHLREYHDYDINSSIGRVIPPTIDAAKEALKKILGKEYYVSISEDEIDSFITEDEECTEDHDEGEN